MPLKLDFSIASPILKLIECQGLQHYEIVEFFGGEKEFIKRKINDKIKYDWCQTNNIFILYITYLDTQQDIEQKVLDFISRASWVNITSLEALERLNKNTI